VSNLFVAAVEIDLHKSFSQVVLIYAGLMAAWGLFLYLRRSNPAPGYLGSLVIAEGVFLVQGLIGIVVFAAGHRPHNSLHYLYGLVLVLTLPTAYFMSARGIERRDSLIFGLACLFLVGVAIRGITTGGK
jgi:heme A synthase